MKDKIKRMAQLLFDNAEYFTEELRKSNNYRNIAVELSDYKTGEGSQQVSFRIYDERGTNDELRDGSICIERIRTLFIAMNENVGVTPLPEPVEIRETL